MSFSAVQTQKKVECVFSEKELVWTGNLQGTENQMENYVLDGGVTRGCVISSKF